MAKKVITILEEAEGVVIEIRTNGRSVKYECEDLDEAFEVLPHLDELQAGE
ncbi:hypothetical protein [Pseudoalteromonas arabiensis]|uniref:hypothetical protein n=1 Tax=Pseudoalteromonas arabiensis TaxID=874454 RepID=UPI000A84F918|nr:hypothetical protein [Pseudoalteromonas arabiensis]